MKSFAQFDGFGQPLPSDAAASVWAQARAQQGALLTLAQAAARAGIHPKTARRLAAAGKLPGALRVGHLWRVDPTVQAARSDQRTEMRTDQEALDAALGLIKDLAETLELLCHVLEQWAVGQDGPPPPAAFAHLRREADTIKQAAWAIVPPVSEGRSDGNDDDE